jgi:chromosome segregation ATPase
MQDDVLVKQLIDISTSLSTNTEATKNIEKHLATLNGKVATNEAIMSTLRAAVDLHATAIDALQKDQNRRKEDQQRWKWFTIDKLFGIVYVIATAWLLIQFNLDK